MTRSQVSRHFWSQPWKKLKISEIAVSSQFIAVDLGRPPRSKTAYTRAIVMLLWSASPFGSDRADAPALVIDEINSRMWDALKLGHLAIKERVGNLIRWGFFAEQTIKKHKAVALTPGAGSAISNSLAETKPRLVEVYAKLVPQQARLISA